MTTDVTVSTFGKGGEVLDQHVVQISGDEELRHLAPDNLRQAYQTLRSWADDARATDAAWDTLTQAQKDARLHILFARLGPFMDRLADLLSELRKA